jgi:carboxypeptidase Taq
METQTAYEDLIRRTREQSLLNSCAAVLGWDEQTYMPKGGATLRGDQMALLAGLAHERATDPRIGELLDILEASNLTAEPRSDTAVNIREIRRGFDRRTRLPRTLVEELARTTSVAQSEWVAARSANSFAHFRPWLEKIVALKRQESACLAVSGAVGAGATYDPLLDEFEPGATTAALTTLFASLRRELVPLVASIAEAARKRPAPQGTPVLTRLFPRDRQKVFAEAAAAAIGFDFDKGRLDIAAHPFCTGIGPGDCRITTRYDEHQFSDAFFGVLHEVGHALYEQGLDPAHHGTPMGESVSLGVHESQSRLWENAVGRGKPFWTYWFPLAKRIFHEALSGTTLDEFHAAINQVEPSLIRVQADEATYNLHIIIRFEIEQALLSGDLSVSDLPGAWNQKFTEMLGVTPTADANGCLQDIHWSAGLVGYFPTYTLGNIFAAQLFAKARTELGGLDDSFAKGDFPPLLSWLRENIHRHGQRDRSAALVERVTGSPPDHRPLIESLRAKYAPLYDL